jgi:hypothetical protein
MVNTTIDARCPSCGELLRYPDIFVGTTCPCPNCKAEIVLNEGTASTNRQRTPIKVRPARQPFRFSRLLAYLQEVLHFVRGSRFAVWLKLQSARFTRGTLFLSALALSGWVMFAATFWREEKPKKIRVDGHEYLQMNGNLVHADACGCTMEVEFEWPQRLENGLRSRGLRRR